MSTISTTNRLSGLASGLDTETIVEGLTESYKTKINEAEQQKQILAWKQEYYQGITSNLYDFQQKYFGSSSSGSMTIIDSFTKLSAGDFSSSYLTVTPGSSATQSDIYIRDIVSLASSAKVQSSNTVTSAPMMTVDTGNLDALGGSSLNITLDGIEETLTFADQTYTSTDDVATALQSLINNAFGTGRITVTVDGDNMSLSAASSTLVIEESGETNEASAVLSFTDGATNKLNLESTVAECGLATDTGDTIAFEINGVSFSFTSASTMSDIIDEVNNSEAGVAMTYSSLSDKFTIAATETGAGSKVTVEDVEGTFLNAVLGTGIKTDGTDAVVKLSTDGSTDESSLITVTRSSNTFDIDGTTYTLKGKASGTTEENLNISIGVDADTVVETITSFVKDYNELLASITDKLTEKLYSDYKPLTDDQKEELTDDEEKAWTEKAKSGLLRSDSTLTALTTQLRSCMLSNVNEVGSSVSIGTVLSGIGITSTSYSDKGQLTINENTLRAAISKDSDAVMNLFTQKSSISYSQYSTAAQKTTRYNESGLLWRLSDIVQNSLSTTGIKGTLIELIGSPKSQYSGTSMYSSRITDMEDKIDDLEEDLEDAEDRYYAKFTAMETALSTLNSQSSWISQMLSN